jgi:mannosyltransferase
MNIKILNRNYLFLALLLVISLYLRFYHLSYQSFWLDEIHTAKEGAMGIRELLSFLDCCDQHPPLFYVTEKIVFYIFGNNEFFARLPCAIIGTISIWGIFLLGRELFDEETGLIAGIFTCFNSFHLEYSQEARPYIFIFCFVVFSFFFLIRFIKTPRLRFGIAYAVFTLLALYFHYFSIFIVISQIVIALIAWIAEKAEKRKFFLNFMISGLMILVLFSFQIRHILSISNISSFWIEKPKDSFAKNIVSQFFGNSDLLAPFIVLLLVTGVLYLFRTSMNKSVDFKEDSSSLALVVFICWSFLVFMLPYLRSLLEVPMIVPRYFISILPVFLLILSIALKAIQSSIVRLLLVSSFCLLSITDIFLVQDYYHKVKKTQFRELASFIMEYNPYTLNAPLTSWHQEYYLNKFGFKGEINGQNVREFCDRAVADSNNLHGFWLADAHGAYPPSQEILGKLSQNYYKVRSANFYDAWAILYLNKKDQGALYEFIDEKSFDSSQTVFDNGEKVIPLWDNRPLLKQISLPKGKYRIEILSSGLPADSIYPHLNFKFAGETIGSFFTEKSLEYSIFNLSLPTDKEGDFVMFMDNDLAVKSKGEDRNAFIKSVLIIKEL